MVYDFYHSILDAFPVDYEPIDRPFGETSRFAGWILYSAMPTGPRVIHCIVLHVEHREPSMRDRGFTMFVAACRLGAMERLVDWANVTLYEYPHKTAFPSTMNWFRCRVAGLSLSIYQIRAFCKKDCAMFLSGVALDFCPKVYVGSSRSTSPISTTCALMSRR